MRIPPRKIVVAIAALVLVTGAAFWLWAQTDSAARYVAGQLSAATGLPAQVGSFSVGFLPRPSAGLREVVLSQPEGYGEPALLTAGRIEVVLPWASLLGGAAQLVSVRIDGLQLQLRVQGDGSDNWTAVVERLATLGGEGPAEFAIGELELDKGLVDFRAVGEATPRFSTTVAATAEGIAPASDFPLTLRLAGQAAGYTMHLSFESKVNMDLEAELHQLQGSSFKGWISGGELPLAGVEFSGGWQQAGVDLKNAIASIEAGAIKLVGLDASYQLAASFQDAFTARFELNSGTFAPRAVANTLGQPLPDTRDAAAFASAVVALQGELGEEGLAISSLRGQLDDTQFEGEATLSFAGVAPSVQLGLDRLVLDWYLPPDAPRKAATAEATLEDAVKQLEALEVDADIRIGELTVRDARLKDVRIRIEAGGS